MDKYSYLSNAHPEVIDSMYKQYKENAESVDASWRQFFEGFEFARTDFSSAEGGIPENVSKEFKVIQLINGYRQRGHLFTKTNPVRERRQYSPSLAIENFGLSVADMDTVFQAGNEIGIGASKLRDIVAHLEQTYCQSIGCEFVYLRSPEVIKWLQSRMEGSKNTPNFSKAEKKTILEKLNQAVLFENFLATKFVGQKRFSLEGGEALIPALDSIMECGADLGVQDFVLGMAHRGRLNVLTNILNKQYKDVFTEFEGLTAEDTDFDGDVKYHQGYSSDQLSNSGKHVHMSLTPNPSHLEAVDPVVEGIARAKIDHKHGGNNSQVCPILMHGDAALAGQGIVYEVIQMSQLDGYKTGGTIHVVTNNQVGFTTNYTDGRSSTYCTDVAKVTLSPVFHVNGDDVEAVVFVSKLAMEFRQEFKRDVFIDILCYRKYGHNEGDEPRFTQPILYKAIAKHPNPLQLYVEKLVNEGTITGEEAKQLEKEFKANLEANLAEAKQRSNAKITSFLEGTWSGLKQAGKNSFDKSPETGVDKKAFLQIAEKITSLPKDKAFFNKIQKIFEERAAMIKNDAYDWAMGELMAYATLMNEGHFVRLSGQDVERGTFSHRHAVVKVEDSEEEYVPLNNAGTKAKFEVYNSLLSEYAVLGYEYGYAFASPEDLIIWEAQFGDFFNGAQIIIDQFLSSAEYKWKRMNGLVMLLPHGYEGQGPEHSSARMERFLQMCADNNMQIVNTTTPANQFHVLRRQLKRDFRKPLICFTPKKLLRYPACVSSINDFTSGSFQEVIDDPNAKAADVKTLILCCGKIYYELAERKQKEGANDVAIVRIEQLYPYPQNQIDAVFAKYKGAKKILWAQEEPENMGPWRHMFGYLHKTGIEFVGREASASPATGYLKVHNEQSEQILSSLFAKKLEKTKS
ncbi:MAG TPA: 2-oxoglutarate dehydrogenase E1 component [Flavobacteriales bacterium]|nr:2-oxoglutarate dehydrogenase E1 component [Flavobacteriales bacterium]